MWKVVSFISILTIFLLFLTGCSNHDGTDQETDSDQGKVTLTISAAASLRDAMSEIQHLYRNEHPEVTLHFNYGGSGSLQQQISKGAPADLFISAAEDKFDRLVEEGKIDKSNSTNLLGNSLVLIVPEEEKTVDNFTDLTKKKINKIAIGTPESVPAGKYGKEALENMGVWKDMEPDVVYAKDVRQVLSYVETGNVDAGLVYKTDAVISDRVKIVQTAEQESHSPIVYPAGIINDTKHYEETKDFYTYLQSDEALKVFAEYGFHVE